MDNAEKFSLALQNAKDRETVAMALFRAGYTVREVRCKDNGKTIILLDYWR